MRWHPDVDLEIAAEFRRLAPSMWCAIEDCLWLDRQRKFERWAAHGAWWMRTTEGRRKNRRARVARIAQQKVTVVAVRACATCGKTFELNAYTESRHRASARVCSPGCKSGQRKDIKPITIDGESMPLAQWAKRYGLRPQLVFERCARGWDVRKALTTPAHRPGCHRRETKKAQPAEATPSGPRRSGRRPCALSLQARAAGLSYEVVKARVKLLGWSVERALSTPVRGAA